MADEAGWKGCVENRPTSSARGLCVASPSIGRTSKDRERQLPLHIRFDLDFDTGSWPGPNSDREATAGEVWVGPAGLLSTLETALGLGGEYETLPYRVAALMANLQKEDGFWNTSAEADPSGVAHTLLGWRDELWMAGWRAQPMGSRRLDSLGALTRDLPPGIPDRLVAVTTRLETRRVDIERIDVLCDPRELSACWRQLFHLLTARGVDVRQTPPLTAPPRDAARLSDLELVRASILGESRCTPLGDGTIQLVRSEGPLDAAEEAAAWMAACAERGDMLVIGADRVLDAALRRHGLPRTGARPEPLFDAPSSILALVLVSAVTPRDPQLMLELLTAPLCPFPSDLRDRLASALHQCPAVNSDTWNATLERELKALEAAGNNRVRPRVERLLAPFETQSPNSDGFPVILVEEAVERLGELKRLFGARSSGSGDTAWSLGGSQCRVAIDVLEACGEEALRLPQLLSVIAQAAQSCGAGGDARAEAGLVSVADPGGIVGVARTVIWWNCTRSSAPTPPRTFLSTAELKALQNAGTPLPDPAEVAVLQARRWRRPLQHAAEHLVMFCPRRSANGDEEFVHPFFDEVLGTLTGPSVRSRLQVSVPCAVTRAPRTARSLQALPTGVLDWPVTPDLLHPREEESPSSLGLLVSCSVRWALQHVARVRTGHSAALTSEARLLGNLAHEVLADVFSPSPLRLETVPTNTSSEDGVLKAALPSPEEAGRLAEASFDRLGPRLAGELFLPTEEGSRSRVRLLIADAARDLARLLHAAGGTVSNVETTLRETRDGYIFQGRPDIVVQQGTRPTVLDFKWGSQTHYLDAMRAGSAYQLAAYAHLIASSARAGDPPHGSAPPEASTCHEHADPPLNGETPTWRSTLPDVGYYVLQNRRLLLSEDATLDAGSRVPGPSPALTWNAFEKSIQRRLQEILEGRLQAPGAPQGTEWASKTEARIENEQLVLPAGCDLCDFGRLCARSFGAPTEEADGPSAANAAPSESKAPKVAEAHAQGARQVGADPLGTNPTGEKPSDRNTSGRKRSSVKQSSTKEESQDG